MIQNIPKSSPIKDKYTNLRSKFISYYKNTFKKVRDLEYSFDKLHSLPQYTSWRKLSRIDFRIDKLNEKIAKLETEKSRIEVHSNKTIQSLHEELDKESWYHGFYNLILPILHKSKTKENKSSLEEAIEPYNQQTQQIIKQDLNNLLIPDYKKIVYINGKNGYGWYSSKEEGHEYLGSKADTERLQSIFKNAKFEDPYDYIFHKDIGWSR